MREPDSDTALLLSALVTKPLSGPAPRNAVCAESPYAKIASLLPEVIEVSVIEMVSASNWGAVSCMEQLDGRPLGMIEIAGLHPVTVSA